MSLQFSLWNVHSWLKRHHVAHSYSLQNDAEPVRGVRLTDGALPQPGFAQITDAADGTPFASVLVSGDNYIYFKHLRAIQAMDEINRMLVVYHDWYQSLKRASLSCDAMTELLRQSETLLPFPIAVFQADRMVAAAPAYKEKLEQLWEDYQQQTLEQMLYLYPSAPFDISAASDAPCVVYSPLYHGKQVMFSSVRTDANELFVLTAFSESEPFSPGDVHLISLLADAIRTNLRLYAQAAAHPLPDPRRYFLSCAAGETPEPAQTQRILQRLGWSAAHPITLFRFEMAACSYSVLLDKLLQTLTARFPSAFCFLYDNAVFLLFSSADPASFPAPSAFQTLLDTGQFVASQSNIGTDFSALPQLLQQAQETLQTARQRNVAFLSSHDMLLDDTRRALYASGAVQSLIHPAVRLLQRTDSLEQTDYVHTLRCYLFHGCNCSAAAKALHIHRNTLLHRLDRISELTGASIDTPQEQEALLLSLLVAKPFAS